jgi:hypothetical protein
MRTKAKPSRAAGLSEETSIGIGTWARHIMSELPADDDDARAVLELVNKMFAVASSSGKSVAHRRRD